MRPTHLLSLLLVAAACTSHDGQTGDPQTPAPKVELRASIASAQLVQDCPDPPSESPGAAASEVVRQEKSLGDSNGNWTPPCSQSTMQLTLAHDGKQAMPFEVKAVRVTAAGTGALLGTAPFRGPTKWTDGGKYEPWDQKLTPGAEVKVSYKLGQPDWSVIAKALGSDDTYGQRYVLEVDLTFAGRSITVRSPEFEREYPERIVT